MMQEQYVRLNNGHQVYTKTIGTEGPKLLTLHGGPGFTHECFANLPELLNPKGIQVIYYDQLGSYFSGMPEDTEQFHLESFASHLHEVVEQVKPQFILAHSSGVMVLVEYLLTYRPKSLQGIILLGMPTSFSKFQQNVLQLRQLLPSAVLQRMEQLEKEGKVLEPEYQQLLMQEWFGRYYYTASPWPQPLQECWSHFSIPVLVNTLGPGPFVFDGPWTSWDSSSELHKIDLPTLLVGFPEDFAFDEDLKEWQKELSNSRYYICKEGAHFGWWQAEDEFAEQLANFCRR